MLRLQKSDYESMRDNFDTGKLLRFLGQEIHTM
jgi:hypothetical protein